MPAVHICPLSQLTPTVTASGASHLITLINLDTPVPRPDTIAAENHLFIGINDIVEPAEGLVLAADDHVTSLIGFVESWDQTRPLVIHCFAGISRSTAAAFIALCVARPARNERAIAQALRQASPIATPNSRLVAIADRLLGRDGRMVAAIEEIGHGESAMENVPFALELED
jgi:predicted protein tyrosine phosphatase